MFNILYFIALFIHFLDYVDKLMKGYTP